MLLSDVVKRLRLVAPLQLGEKWDNVGLLVEGSADKSVDRVLLTNDLTSEVLNEAVVEKCQMIISYHPFIFAPLKRITRNDWKQRLIIDCIQSDISVFSPHTCWDSASWMNNYNLVKSALGEKGINSTKHDVKPILTSSFRSSSGNLFLSKFSDEQISDCRHDIYTILSKLVSSNIFANLRKSPDANGIDVITETNLSKSLPIKPVSVSEVLCSELYGCGLKLTLTEQELTEGEAMINVKHFLDLRYIRYSAGANRNNDSIVRTIAVCAGSGSSVLKDLFGSVDLVITGEMSHHEILDAKFKGTSVVLTEHSNSERSFLNVFKNTIENLELLPQCQLVVSSCDKDPLDVR